MLASVRRVVVNVALISSVRSISPTIFVTASNLCEADPASSSIMVVTGMGPVISLVVSIWGLVVVVGPMDGASVVPGSPTVDSTGMSISPSPLPSLPLSFAPSVLSVFSFEPEVSGDELFSLF